MEAGLGGRHDATNVLRSRVVLLTNVGLEHTDVLGDTVEAIAAEKLAVVHTDDTIVVLPDDTFARLVPRGRIVIGGAREAAEAFSGHAIDTEVDVELPGRLERRPGEIRDGAHTPDAVDWLRERLPAIADYTDLRVDPRGQGRGGDAPEARAARRSLRRDRVDATPARSTPRSSPRGHGGTSPSSRQSLTPSPRSGAHTSSASRCS